MTFQEVVPKPECKPVNLQEPKEVVKETQEKISEDMIEDILVEKKSESIDIEHINGEGSDSEYEDCSDEDMDDEMEEDANDEMGGWINPSNLKQKQKEMRHTSEDTEPSEVAVACLTTDYAMQVGS